MKISINWLRDFVDIPRTLSGKHLAELLTLHTAEVENIHSEASKLENMVVGKIVKVKKHPNADKLILADTNIGEKIVQIVCGGKNVKEGLVVAVALPCAWIDWHGAGKTMQLEKTAIRGEESFGMICAGEEIGLSPSPAGEIMELDQSLRAGTPLATALGKDDIILEIDNKSLTHRPDLWGHYGIAREFAAILGKKLKPYTAKAKFSSNTTSLTISMQAPKIIPRFTACLIKGIKIGQSPEWIQQKLGSVGVRPINNIVDITNFVMLEYGQPMHAYDRKKVATDTLEARLAKKGETIETIDHKKYPLTEEDLIITNGKIILGIAGIMGGLDSEINENTTEIILEAANWDPVVTRKTSQRLGLRSDASQRFEKSLDPSMCPIALEKAVELIIKICPSAKTETALMDQKNWKAPIRRIELSLPRLASKIGKTVSSHDAKKILTALDFNIKAKKDALIITVPSHRATKDINIEDDLVEEVARMYGYQNISAELPKLPIKIPLENHERQLKHRIRKCLSLGFGANEVVNYSFYGKKDMVQCLLDEKKHIRLKNYLSEEQSHMRISLLPNILKNIRENLKHRKECCLYEIGRTYKENGEFMPQEEKKIMIAIVKNGKNPFYGIKGILETFWKMLGIERPHYEFGNAPIYAHPQQYAQITLSHSQEMLAEIYVVNPAITLAYEIETMVGMCEIHFSKLSTLTQFSKKTYTPLPKFPETSFDVSVIVSQKTHIADIASLIQESDADLVKKVELFDVYEGKNMETGKKALAFTVTLQAPDRTLTDGEMTEIQNKTFQTLQKNGGVIRGLT